MGAGLERAVDVFVVIEGRDHDDRERVVDAGAGELPGGLDPVEVGHADVEQAYIGSQLAGERDGVEAVGGLSDDLDVGLSVEEHREADPDDLLVVGDEYTDGHVYADGSGAWDRSATPARVGSVASTTQPRSVPGPASRVPPSSEARSRMPMRPNPDGEGFAAT